MGEHIISDNPGKQKDSAKQKLYAESIYISDIRQEVRYISKLVEGHRGWLQMGAFCQFQIAVQLLTLAPVSLITGDSFSPGPYCHLLYPSHE